MSFFSKVQHIVDTEVVSIILKLSKKKLFTDNNNSPGRNLADLTRQRVNHIDVL